MNKFQQRSLETELIDRPDVPFADWEQCLHELNTINTWLGGHAITLDGVRSLADNTVNNLHICEIGCGGGDNIRAIYEKLKKSRINLRFTGIDLNAACIHYAGTRLAHIPGCRWITSDYRKVDFGGDRPDIIFNSLFCHHFTDDALAEMLQWLRSNSINGFFINDLQRHPLAYHSIGLLTRLFSKSYLVRNDAPISVLRGFKKKEWQSLLHQAGVTNYRIQWKWAFRYLISVRNDCR